MAVCLINPVPPRRERQLEASGCAPVTEGHDLRRANKGEIGRVEEQHAVGALHQPPRRPSATTPYKLRLQQ